MEQDAKRILFRPKTQPVPKTITDKVVFNALLSIEPYKRNVNVEPLSKWLVTLPVDVPLGKKDTKLLANLLEQVKQARTVKTVRRSSAVARLENEIERVIREISA